MDLEMKSVNKQGFKCFQMPDGSVYYGEIAFLNKEDDMIYFNFDDCVEEVRPRLRQIRHGYGIQLFGRSEQNILCLYVGQFDRDMKSNKGKAIYPDGSTYEGQFKSDKFDGYGVFTFASLPNGSKFKYDGYWKNGKMQGQGYINDLISNAILYNGQFNNNLFNHENLIHISPLVNETQNQNFIRSFKAHQSRVNKQEAKYDINAVKSMISQMTYIYESQDISLRSFELEIRQGGDAKISAYQTERAKVEFLLRTQGRLYLLFDEFYNQYDAKNWKELYDPDIDHLICNNCITPAIWQPQNFASFDVMVQCRIIDPSLSDDEKQEKFSQLNFNPFAFNVWSKERFSESLEESELLKMFKKRFDKNLPLKYINLIFLETFQQPAE
ncbi:phosphatidylinositol-4-phosphate 5-kinase-like protein [Stylonychia lemnae]|uniref:Phosphatidylinositol-4-phosphate 5-kinase-like protein n=1 Tax=Stylonychia lemnae TaxID=5949 RepID=A0A077ZPN7_STYLE|nr:phosphatidylinositol-4-phosphate 5-kinase-like protein [Stylonychia lemnae]|eukprot:CDW71335.1 phosphatidylinositol-4-phosphate 5-kinase-like protein [Stylonychia lemnae]